MPIYNIQVGTAKVSIEVYHSLASAVERSVFSTLLKTADTPLQIHYRILNQASRLLLYRNKRLTHRNVSLSKIIYALEWQIVNDLIEQNKTTLKIHSAALARRDSGFIFCGAPSTGKTSLAILLMQNGWQFLSDEFALLNSSGEIIPFPRNLIIKPHLRERVRFPADSMTFRINDDAGEKIDAYYLSPLLFGSQIADTPIPLQRIIFLENNTSSGFNLMPIQRYVAFRLLMQNLFSGNRIGQPWIDRLVKLVNTYPVYQLKIFNPLELSEPDRHALIARLTGIK